MRRATPSPLPRRFTRLAGWVALACLPCSAAWAKASVPPTKVVLVHGIYDTGRVFKPLVRTLEKRGYRCLTPALTPNDCSAGVRALSLQLARSIDAGFGRSAPVVLIGFSMGGLIARDYVQNLASPGRVQAVFLISPPNHGTLWAAFARKGTRELATNSRFIQALNQNLQAWRHVPVCTYWTPLDLMIMPATSSLWPVGDTKMIPCLLHRWMVRNPRLVADLTARMCGQESRFLRPAAAPPAACPGLPR